MVNASLPTKVILGTGWTLVVIGAKPSMPSEAVVGSPLGWYATCECRSMKPRRTSLTIVELIMAVHPKLTLSVLVMLFVPEGFPVTLGLNPLAAVWVKRK